MPVPAASTKKSCPWRWIGCARLSDGLGQSAASQEEFDYGTGGEPCLLEVARVLDHEDCPFRASAGCLGWKRSAEANVISGSRPKRKSGESGDSHQRPRHCTRSETDSCPQRSAPWS